MPLSYYFILCFSPHQGEASDESDSGDAGRPTRARSQTRGAARKRKIGRGATGDGSSEDSDQPHTSGDSEGDEDGEGGLLIGKRTR